MLQRVNKKVNIPEVCMKDAEFPSPFASGLEYSAPARGTWNIVHTGMLIPESHQVFVCAAGCLRGVVLTAAEMNAADRFSTIAVRENNVLEGDMEELIVDGIGDILSRLPKKPAAILVYTSCVHHFIGCDLKHIYKRLRETYPDVDFTDCYMNPIMRKSGLTPDQLMRRQLYSLIRERKINPKSVNIIGNDLPTRETSELVKIIKESGYILRDINDCRTYEEYQTMGESYLNITYNSAAKAAGKALERRLGQKHLHIPVSYSYDEIEEGYNLLCDELGVPRRSFEKEKEKCEEALAQAKAVIGDTPIALDYTVTMRPVSLARMLVEHGFNLKTLYIDAVSGEDKGDFEKLKELSPDMILSPTVHANMRFAASENGEKLLAIGQKAAYFKGSNHFVNVIESGGMYGFDGICLMASEMIDAFKNEKDAKKLIQIKGMGCSCAL